MGQLDFRAFSNTPPHDRSGVFFGVLFGGVGLVMLLFSVGHLAAQPWDLEETGVETWGRAAERSTLTGDRYVIEVGGKSYSCHRGRQKFSRSEAPVLYDPSDPSRCRAADAADGPSSYERMSLRFSLAATIFGLAWIMAYFAEPRDVWAREAPAGLLRPRLMWAARGALAISVLIMVSFSLFDGRSGSLEGPDPPKRPTAPADGESSSEDGPALGSVHEVPIEELTASAIRAEDWPMARPRIRKLPVRGSSVWLGDPDPIGSRVIASTGRSYHSAGDEHVLVDAATGKVLAKFDDEGRTSAAAGIVVTLVGESKVIVHADDGTIVTPDIHLPPPHRVERVRIVASELEPVVWLFAKSTVDGVVFHGHWEELRDPRVELTETVGFWPKYADGRGGLDVWDPDLASDGCWRLRFRPGQAPECLDEGGAPSMGTHLQVTPQSPWSVAGPFDVILVNRTTGDRFPLVPGCDATELARIPVPPRVFGGCLVRGADRVSFALWSPERTWTFEGPFEVELGIELGLQRAPVTAIEPYGGGDRPIERWVDLEHGRLVHTPPLMSLRWGGSFGYQRKVLVHNTDDMHALWLLDLQAVTLERIAADIGCAHELMQTDLHGDRAVIACSSAAGAGGAARLRGYKWTEVIDFSRKTRWRTNKAFEPKLAADGTVVGVTRSRPAQLVAIDTP